MAVFMVARNRLRARQNATAVTQVIDGRLDDRLVPALTGNWQLLQWPGLSNSDTLGEPTVRPEGAVLRIKTYTGERIAVAVVSIGDTIPSGTAALGHEIEALDVYDIGVFPGERVFARNL